jgi:hypothetical protein
MSSTMGAHRIGKIALLVAGVLIAGTLAALAVASPASAQAQICDPYTKKCEPIVKPKVLRRDPAQPNDKEEPLEFRGSSIREGERLPFTGADLTLFAATAFAAVGTGTILVRSTRSRRSRS